MAVVVGVAAAGLELRARFPVPCQVRLRVAGQTVATVAPGFVETEMAGEHLEGDLGDATRAQSPFNRVAAPEEIAAAVVWLASPEAQWASGSILDLNGASYLRM